MLILLYIMIAKNMNQLSACTSEGDKQSTETDAYGIACWSYTECTLFSLDYYLRQASHNNCSKVSINNKLFRNISSVNSSFSVNILTLDLNQNQIELISPDSMVTITQSLTQLNLRNNYLNQEFYLAGDRLLQADISYNRLSRLKKRMFERLPLLQELDLISNMISELDIDCFTLLPSLLRLNLAKNFIHYLPVGVFRNQNKLIKLDLTSNYISHLNGDWFYGIESLMILKLDSNPIREIEDDAFSKMKNITSLYVSHLYLTTIRFAGLVSLKYIQLDGNQISNLDSSSFVGMKSLTRLNIQSSNIKKLAKSTFSQLCRLNSIDLSFNRLRQIQSSVFTRGCLNNSLERLELKFNKIEQIDEDAFPASLLDLDLASNRLERIKRGHFRGLSLLGELRLNRNLISSIERDSFSDLKRVWFIHLDENCLFEIDLSLFAGLTLTNLNLDLNKIKRIKPSERQISITTLRLDSNQLSLVDISIFESFSSLTWLILSNNYLLTLPWCDGSSDATFLKSLTYFDLSNNPKLQCDEVNPNSYMNNLEQLGLAHLNQEMLKNVDFLSFPHLMNLDVSGNGHVDLNVELFSAQYSLNMSKTYPIELNNKWNKELRVLDLSYKIITNGSDFHRLPELIELYLIHCNVPTLDMFNFSYNPFLHVIDLSYNLIEEIKKEHFSPLTYVNMLKFRGNRISFIEKDSFKAFSQYLGILDLGENRIKSFPEHHFDFMATLLMDNNKLDSANFEISSGLFELSLENNNLTEIPSDRLKNVDATFVDFLLGSNEIKEIKNETFSSMPSLKKIDLSNNQIEFIQPRSFLKQTLLEILDLSDNWLSGRLDDDTFIGLISLINLNMSDNSVEYVQKKLFVELFNLESLDLSYNPIKHVEDYSFTKQSELKFLYFKNCSDFTSFTVNTFYGLSDSLEMLYLNNAFIRDKEVLETILASFKTRPVKNVLDISYYNGLDLILSPYSSFDNECDYTLYLVRTNVMRLNLNDASVVAEFLDRANCIRT